MELLAGLVRSGEGRDKAAIDRGTRNRVTLFRRDGQ